MPPGTHEFVAGRVIALGDVAAMLRASDLERAHAIAAVLGSPPSHSEPARIELIYAEAPPPIPTGTPTESFGPLRLWRGGDVLSLSYEGRISAVATSTGIVVGGAGPDLVDAWRYIFQFALAHVLALHDRFLLHAGGVISAGRSFLVFGESGAGKSTLVLAALDAGWAALSDDLVVLRHGANGAEACGIGKPFRVPSDVLDPAPDEGSWSGDDPRRRWVVDGYAWDDGWFPVRGSIAVGHGRAPHAELEALSETSIVELVLSSFVACPEPRHLRRCFPIAAEVGRGGGFQLCHAADPAARLAEAARALDTVAEAIEPRRA